ncbi:34226_t:CDS:2 [Gigaspora margarita]|uniref:34226_t:CDS:1 n=1 Tax=Gigaspora margarita TaxID=4874 RepID=A0ABN7VRQ2_GIGMA|nr:34226_t:CDS:2 [Gigaspora margarita]
MSASDLEETSQTENSQEIDPISKVSQFEIAKYWKYFEVEREKKLNIYRAVVEWLVVDNRLFDIINSKGFCRFMLCQTISLTTDLWTARNKTGYIGVTTHWLNDQFELNKILLCLEQMPYPYMGLVIREFLIYIVSDFNLLTKVLYIVIDNGSNMYHQIQCIQDLVKFFDSPKQSQRLDNAQAEKCKNKQRNLSDSNLTLSDDSDWLLIELRPAIKWLLVMLPLQEDLDSRRDGQKIQNLMLHDNEWKLVEKLIELLEPFNSATEYFSAGYDNDEGINILKFDLNLYLYIATDFDYDNVSFNIQRNRLENDPEIIVNKVQIIIYNSLFEYWNRPSQICLLATLLNPQLKEMTFTNDDVCDHTIEECRLQLRQLISPPEEHPISSNLTNISSNNMFKNIIFGKSQRSQESMDELDYYLDFRWTPVAPSDSNPLLW